MDYRNYVIVHGAYHHASDPDEIVRVECVFLGWVKAYDPDRDACFNMPIRKFLEEYEFSHYWPSHAEMA